VAFGDAFDEYSNNPLLRNPFWQKQFAIKKAQRDLIFDSFQLVSPVCLKDDCYPGWGAADPVAALNKRAERNQVLSILDNGKRFYPIEQFDYKADTPKLTAAFTDIMKAFSDNGGITQEEMLFWLCSQQPLLLPYESSVDEAIQSDNIEQGWDTLKKAGPSEQPMVSPLACLLDGDSDTALRLFHDWTDIEQDGEPKTRKESIDAVKKFMAIKRISIDDLRQG
jgi:hypothetical protein